MEFNENLLKPIPTVGFPNIQSYNIASIEEDIVPLSTYGILVDSQYYAQGIAGAYKDCYARESVAKRLLKAQEYLPPGLKLKVYDAYRPIIIQQRLWNYFHQKIKNENPKMTEEEVDLKTSFFVSRPSYNVKQPSLHNSGGAVDVTLVTDNGYALNMGTLFDDFTNRAWTNHFEIYESNAEVCQNRRILYNTMNMAGFTNLPSEWWHYDYGTKFWAYFNNTDALYEGILDIDFPNRFPLI